MELSGDVKALVALLEEEGLPEGVPGEVVELARRAGVIAVLAARPGALEALGEGAIHEFQSGAAMGALRLAELREIASEMGERGIDVVPLKGMAYGLMFERGGPMRPMADIDLLVRAGDYQAAGEVILGHGYEEVFQYPLSRAAGYHERQFTRDGRLVEVHRAFLRGRRITVDYDALWSRTILLDRDGVSCRRMSPEDTLLYHCFHMGMHEFALGGLRSVWELRRLILEDRPDLPGCARRAREWGTMRISWCALRLLEACFPGTPMCELTPSPPLRILLEKFVIVPSIALLTSPGLLPRPVQLLRKALLVDSATRAASYLLWHLKSNALLRLSR